MSESDGRPGYRARLYEQYGRAMQSAPERFDEAAARRWGRAYDWYLRGWLPMSKQARIVDLACGYGRLLHFFRERGWRNITGVDISPDQVRRAREVVADVHEANVLDFLEERRGQFDLITALDLIEHLTKDEALRLLAGCRAALKPGGRLVLQTPNADSPFGMAVRYGDFTHEICFNPNLLSRLLALHGFAAVEAREVGPVPWGYSLASTLRWSVWKAIRAGLQLSNLAETGDVGSRILTRTFLVSATRV
ncbi:MAG: methyltransferase domain-containing protein [Burkholderiaceae bacterium]|nr:methyltransferase domain-containing protein [Burkholderiaceae bacterium]